MFRLKTPTTTKVAKLIYGSKIWPQQQLYQNVRLNRISLHLNFTIKEIKRLKIPVILRDKINYKPGYDRQGVGHPTRHLVYGPSKK